MVDARRCSGVRRRCLLSFTFFTVARARSSTLLSQGLLPDSFTAAALDQAQFGLLDAKADFTLSHPLSLRGSKEHTTRMSEINSDAQVQEMKSIGVLHEAELELAQATADEAAAEALAAEELRKADEASARAKALSNALTKGQVEELMEILKVPFSPDKDIVPSDSKAILVSTQTGVLQAPEDPAAPGNGTDSSARMCDPSVGLPCKAQRVITFDYRLSMGAGYAEWAALITLWVASVWIACCVCNCGLHQFCCCQCWTCASLVFLALATITTIMKGA
ncbi:unnamed protein product [Cladocopium goreaui]|uniref:Cell number regulator 10 n=1 Tax=Cladocopium goreaui TaxID=2562237 RepID=A0A9P1GHZ8_9DINO|nr:unnamed protein product [Cladocopium goreaui]